MKKKKAAAKRGPGRPSVLGPNPLSLPSIRVSAHLHGAVQTRADLEGVTVAELVRQALYRLFDSRYADEARTNQRRPR